MDFLEYCKQIYAETVEEHARICRNGHGETPIAKKLLKDIMYLESLFNSFERTFPN